MQLYLNDSFMIRKIIVAAVPAALVAVGMTLATSQPASSQMRGGGMGGATNTNQVYPNNQRGGFLNPGALQLNSGGGRGGTNGFYLPMQGVNGTQYGVSSGRGGHGPGGAGGSEETDRERRRRERMERQRTTEPGEFKRRRAF